MPIISFGPFATAFLSRSEPAGTTSWIVRMHTDDAGVWRVKGQIVCIEAE